MIDGEPKLAILAANERERERLASALEWLEAVECPYDLLVQSIWSDLEGVIDWARGVEEAGARAILAAAGSEPQAPGLVSAGCNLPVIAIALSPRAARTALATSPAAPVVITRADSPRHPSAAAHAVATGLRILAAAEPEFLGALEQFRALAAEDAAQNAGEAPAPRPIRTAPRTGTPPVIPLHETPSQPESARPASKETPTYVINYSSEVFGKAGAPAPAEDDPAMDAAEEKIDIRPFDFSRPLRGDKVFPYADAEDEPAAPAAPRVPPPARQLGRCPIDTDSPEVDLIEDAVDCLLEGGVIAFPTETVYGLAVDATNPAAVERLFQLKGRPRNKAISLMVDQPRLLAAIARNLTIEVRRLMEAFWPGPLTLILEKRPGNFDHLTDGHTIGVRLPDHPVPLALIQALARPLACTSANMAGEPEATNADEIESTFGDGINVILDGGQIPEKLPSTVLDVTKEPFRILRLGSIGHEQLSAILGEKLEVES